MHGITRTRFDWIKWTISFVCICVCRFDSIRFDFVFGSDRMGQGTIGWHIMRWRIVCLFVRICSRFLSFASFSCVSLKWCEVYWNPLHCKINRQIKTKIDYINENFSIITEHVLMFVMLFSTMFFQCSGVFSFACFYFACLSLSILQKKKKQKQNNCWIGITLNFHPCVQVPP